MTRKRCRKLLMGLYNANFMPRNMLNEMLRNGIEAYHSYDIYYHLQYALYLEIDTEDITTALEELDKALRLARFCGYSDSVPQIEQWINSVRHWHKL